MATTTQHQKDYEKATRAYMQHDYRQAATILKQLVADCPKDAMYRLLNGHVQLALENYRESIAEYEAVLTLTKDNSILECARTGIKTAEERLRVEASNATQVSEFSLESGDEFDFTQPDPSMQNARQTFMQAPLKSSDIDIAEAANFDFDEVSTEDTKAQKRQDTGGETPWTAMWCSWMTWMTLTNCKGLLPSLPL